MALFGAMLRPMAQAASSVALRGQKRFAGGLKIHDQNKAHVFGEVPGHHKKEGWETIWYLTLAASAVMLVFGIGQKPVTGIEHWALDEAAARNKVEAKGGTLEYGVIYSNQPAIRFRKTDAGMPEVIDDDEDE
ncbi:hypothetical protein JKP88DRAFT_347194 [Tribonema minus]|uniref:NADH dehydrogenase [ubiquinone] 1 beta subcomplex subunit 11, mitochondrial n=1 Tax=Tribonema minus TaxID=303371 RepID=A0A835YHQ5_9STRA|nr:hypothetical protein JKP88DRAFT_347194 [Tribonema minus]